MSAIPQHKLYEFPNSRSIQIEGWSLTASTNPISNAPECDALQSTLGFPLPEMTFGNNYLTIEHPSSGFKYSFTTPEALKQVKKGELVEGDGGVKVGYADKWMQSRQGISTSLTISTGDLHIFVLLLLLMPERTHLQRRRCLQPSLQNRMIGHIPRSTQAIIIQRR